MHLINEHRSQLADMTEEEKYKRKAAMLQRALAAADVMDKKYAVKATAAKQKAKAQKQQEPEESKKRAAEDATPVLG